ncbi:Basic proline-rich protein precursor [Brachybacterium faecium]|nr:Basic proline-rich protein precursor [Brachybacterium faecium]
MTPGCSWVRHGSVPQEGTEPRLTWQRSRRPNSHGPRDGPSSPTRRSHDGVALILRCRRCPRRIVGSGDGVDLQRRRGAGEGGSRDRQAHRARAASRTDIADRVVHGRHLGPVACPSCPQKGPGVVRSSRATRSDPAVRHDRPRHRPDPQNPEGGPVGIDHDGGPWRRPVQIHARRGSSVARAAHVRRLPGEMGGGGRARRRRDVYGAGAGHVSVPELAVDIADPSACLPSSGDHALRRAPPTHGRPRRALDPLDRSPRREGGVCGGSPHRAVVRGLRPGRQHPDHAPGVESSSLDAEHDVRAAPDPVGPRGGEPGGLERSAARQRGEGSPSPNPPRVDPASSQRRTGTPDRGESGISSRHRVPGRAARYRGAPPLASGSQARARRPSRSGEPRCSRGRQPAHGVAHVATGPEGDAPQTPCRRDRRRVQPGAPRTDRRVHRRSHRPHRR